MGAIHQALLSIAPPAGGAGLDPGSFLAGLDWDMDPDTISGNDGDPVVDWLDISGADKHYGQNTSGNQPTLKLNIINGHAVVRFATDDKLLPDPNPRSFSSANTLIIVCKPTSATNAYILAGGGVEGNPAIISGFSSTAFEYYNTGAERQTFASSASGFHILTIARTDDTGNIIGYYDGTQVFSVAVNSSRDWGATAVEEIGSNGPGAGDGYYNGDIARILHFNQNHAGTGGLDDLHDAIKAFYGIA